MLNLLSITGYVLVWTTGSLFYFFVLRNKIKVGRNFLDPFFNPWMMVVFAFMICFVEMVS